MQIAKGLIVRSDQRGYAMIEHLLALFQDAELAPAAAASLGTIAEEKDGVLSKENAAVIRVSRATTLACRKNAPLLTSPRVTASVPSALLHLLAAETRRPVQDVHRRWRPEEHLPRRALFLAPTHPETADIDGAAQGQSTEYSAMSHTLC